MPEAYIEDAVKLFDDADHLSNGSTRAFLRKFPESFVAWINANPRRRTGNHRFN